MKRILVFLFASLFVLVGEASAKRLAVSVDKANIRSGPGLNHDILWSVGKYYPLDTLRKSGGHTTGGPITSITSMYWKKMR